MSLSFLTRERLALIACLFHLFLIGGYAFIAPFKRRITPEARTSPGPLYSCIQLYTLYTALHADYGFFAPTVGSSHELKIEVIDQEGAVHIVSLNPANREVSVRFSTMLLIFTRDRIFQELLARSIAAMAYKQFPGAVRITVSVYRYNLPPLAEYQSGKRPTRTLYFKSVYSTASVSYAP